RLVCTPVAICPSCVSNTLSCFFFFQAEDGIRDRNVTGVQTCALPIYDPVLDGDRGVALDAEVGALLDRASIEKRLGDHILRVRGEAGIPELDHVDRPGVEEDRKSVV